MRYSYVIYVFLPGELKLPVAVAAGTPEFISRQIFRLCVPLNTGLTRLQNDNVMFGDSRGFGRILSVDTIWFQSAQ